MKLYRFTANGLWGFDVRKDAGNLPKSKGPWAPGQSSHIDTEKMSEKDWQRYRVDQGALINDIQLHGCHVCPEPDGAI